MTVILVKVPPDHTLTLHERLKSSSYLEVFGNGGFPVVLHLSELCPQALHLVLHLHDVLKVPLSSQVQHLDGLGHVLHLQREISRGLFSHNEGWHCQLQLKT